MKVNLLHGEICAHLAWECKMPGVSMHKEPRHGTGIHSKERCSNTVRTRATKRPEGLRAIRRARDNAETMIVRENPITYCKSADCQHSAPKCRFRDVMKRGYENPYLYFRPANFRFPDKISRFLNHAIRSVQGLSMHRRVGVSSFS